MQKIYEIESTARGSWLPRARVGELFLTARRRRRQMGCRCRVAEPGPPAASPGLSVFGKWNDSVGQRFHFIAQRNDPGGQLPNPRVQLPASRVRVPDSVGRFPASVGQFRGGEAANAIPSDNGMILLANVFIPLADFAPPVGNDHKVLSDGIVPSSTNCRPLDNSGRELDNGDGLSNNCGGPSSAARVPLDDSRRPSSTSGLPSLTSGRELPASGWERHARADRREGGAGRGPQLQCTRRIRRRRHLHRPHERGGDDEPAVKIFRGPARCCEKNAASSFYLKVRVSCLRP